MSSLVSELVEIPAPLWALVKVTLALALAWAVHLTLGRRNPRWRVLLWRMALTSLLVLPMLNLVSYLEIPIDVLAWGSPRTVAAPSDDGSRPAMASARNEPMRNATPTGSMASGATILASPGMHRIATAVLILWAMGALIMMVRILRVRGELGRRLKSSRSAPIEMEKLLNHVARELADSRAVKVRRSSEFSSPCLVGFFEPTIVIPDRLIDSLGEKDLRAIFAHELSHLRSRDLLWLWLGRWLTVVYWFHPLNWGIHKAHSAACEEVCDAMAARYVNDTESYSRTLAAVALETNAFEAAAPALSMARVPDVTRRITLLRKRLFDHSLPRGRSSFVLLSAAMVVVALGGLGFVDADETSAESQKADSPETPIVSAHWEEKFYEVYRLEEGEVLKRIAAPFIPERGDYWKANNPALEDASGDLPDGITFHWKGAELENWGAIFGAPIELSNVLGETAIGLLHGEFDGSKEGLDTELGGDWILRPETPKAQLLGALKKILESELGISVNFELVEVERDAIVATGRFEFHPLANISDDDTLHLYSDKMNQYEGYGGSSYRDVTSLLRQVSDLIGRSVIDQTEPSEIVAECSTIAFHRSSYLWDIKDESEFDELLDMLLQSLSFQTSLDFTRRKEKVEVWWISMNDE